MFLIRHKVRYKVNIVYQLLIIGCSTFEQLRSINCLQTCAIYSFMDDNKLIFNEESNVAIAKMRFLRMKRINFFLAVAN